MPEGGVTRERVESRCSSCGIRQPKVGVQICGVAAQRDGCDGGEEDQLLSSLNQFTVPRVRSVLLVISICRVESAAAPRLAA